MVCEFIHTKYNVGEKLLVVLIDPDKLSLTEVANLAALAEKSNVSFFLVGGSLVANPCEVVIDEIKRHSNKPVVLFPGNPNQLAPNADALFFLSLISGRNPDFLIGHHMTAAPVIKKFEIEPISVGYILVDGGKTTSVEYVSNTRPIPRDKTDLAVATAMAGEMLGNKLIYLEAGSGAKYPVPEKIIKGVKKQTNIPIIVGGGLRSKEDVALALNAGADIIVVGNILEKEPERMIEIGDLFSRKVIV